jgi:hypothetical protein
LAKFINSKTEGSFPSKSISFSEILAEKLIAKVLVRKGDYTSM